MTRQKTSAATGDSATIYAMPATTVVSEATNAIKLDSALAMIAVSRPSAACLA